MTVFDAFFAWPDGGIWSNLLASLICLITGLIAGHAGLKRLHAKLDLHHAEKLALAKDHADAAEAHRNDLHEQLMARLDQTSWTSPSAGNEH